MNPHNNLLYEYLTGFQEFADENGLEIRYDPGCGGLAPWPRAWYVVAEEDGFRVYYMNGNPVFQYADPECFEKLLEFLKGTATQYAAMSPCSTKTADVL